MLLLNKALNKIFGSKSDKDIKAIAPIVVQIQAEYAKLSGLSNDALRGKTLVFKGIIKDALSGIDAEIAQKHQEAESLAITEIDAKTALYEQVDALVKNRRAKIEEVLAQLLPQAFAVMRETARRFSENTELVSTATQVDRLHAPNRPHTRIDGDQLITQNTWTAAGNQIAWNMVHYDVQLVGGIALHQGKIAEMATGEGKTLVATLPIYLNALAGEGVHLVTVNDYLAKRDSQWKAPIFEWLGLTIDCIDKYQPNTEDRRKAYQADITYGTNNEFGFDYLRDNMARTPEELVQRPHHYAIVDEVDSVLIDEARTPLIISGPTPKGDQQEYHTFKPRIASLVEEQRKLVTGFLAEAKKLFNDGKTDEAGLPLLRAHRGLPKNKALIKFLSETGVRAQLIKTEAFYMQNQNKEMHKADAELLFVIEEKNNQVELTSKGIDAMTTRNEDPLFFIMPDIGTEIAKIEKGNLSDPEKQAQKEILITDYTTKSDRIHTVNQLLKAYTLFEKDTEYIIDENKVKIVDEQTGRVMEGRRYSDGLHQAIEAKEDVNIEAATQTYATVTLQNYFRMYHKLAGMTGTAETEAAELWEIYKLDVVTIPTNRSISRKDEQDLVYKTAREKYNAAIEEIQRLVDAGRPVLVGTTSVEISELLSRMLSLRKIKHNVLNAKMHQREAEIVAEAGQAGTVTIATNMAGRGTDIKLGANVKEAGGLAIIGTERHDSRRVDRQLRGRAGRQGDPGTSQFYVSLEDQLMRLFGSERVSGIMDKFGYKEGEVIQHSMITNSIERSQKKVEENHFGTRKRLLEYDNVMNSQREVVYKKRRHALFGERLKTDIYDMMYDLALEIAETHKNTKNFELFSLDIIKYFSTDTQITQNELNAQSSQELATRIYNEALNHYNYKNQQMAITAMPIIRELHDDPKNSYEFVVIPFLFGDKQMQLPVHIKKTMENQGADLETEFEKAITLHYIDDSWRIQLRQMDDLKQSVQNVVYEQKDPLVIYKFEAYNLFKQMLSELNKEVVSAVCKAHIPAPEPSAPAPARRPTPLAPPRKQQPLNYTSSNTQNNQEPNEYQTNNTQQQQAPIIAEPRIGRNDNCPCGSGKKFKHCHGKD